MKKLSPIIDITYVWSVRSINTDWNHMNKSTLLCGFLVLFFDPLKPHRCPFFNLLHAGGSHRFRLPKPFSHLLPILGRRAAAAALLLLRQRIWTGVPLIGPRATVHFLFFYSLLAQEKWSLGERLSENEEVFIYGVWNQWNLLRKYFVGIFYLIGRRIWSNVKKYRGNGYMYERGRSMHLYTWKDKNTPFNLEIFEQIIKALIPCEWGFANITHNEIYQNSIDYLYVHNHTYSHVYVQINNRYYPWYILLM